MTSQSPFLLGGAGRSVPPPAARPVKSRSALLVMLVLWVLMTLLGWGVYSWLRPAAKPAAPQRPTRPLLYMADDLVDHAERILGSTSRASASARAATEQIRRALPQLEMNFMTVERRRLEQALATLETARREIEQARAEAQAIKANVQQGKEFSHAQ